MHCMSSLYTIQGQARLSSIIERCTHSGETKREKEMIVVNVKLCAPTGRGKGRERERSPRPAGITLS